MSAPRSKPEPGSRAAAPPSAEAPPASMTRHSAASFGRVRLMVKWIDEHHGAFTISRLIMMTGLKLRSYDETSADDPAVMAKLEPAVRSVLSPAEWAELAAFIDG